jgi:hypothetical protein
MDQAGGSSAVPSIKKAEVGKRNSENSMRIKQEIFFSAFRLPNSAFKED